MELSSAMRWSPVCIASIPELDRSRVRSIKASLVAWAGNLTQPELSMLLSKEGGGIPPPPYAGTHPPQDQSPIELKGTNPRTHEGPELPAQKPSMGIPPHQDGRNPTPRTHALNSSDH